jgi:calcineurin-like phosphoesterase family protein
MIFFTSDEHYGHHNILKYCNRPFANTNEMREAFIERHNAVVKPEDEVWHLGDFSFKADSAQDGVSNVVKRLNGTHRLIAGNHDGCFQKHKGSDNEVFNYMYAFREVNQVRRLTLPGLGEVLLCHLPVQGNDYDNRYQDSAPHAGIYEDFGVKWLIHGHVHGAWRTRDRMINVGVDVWNYTPVSLEELVATVTANSAV